MSTSDFVKGYWQIPLHESSRQYTAFLFEDALYQWRRVPFGVRTAGAGFIRGSSLALGPVILEFVTLYVDDAVIASSSFDEHIHHLGCFFKRRIECGFTLNFEKSQYFRSAVPFLDFILTREGVSTEPDKLPAIRDFPEPHNQKQLQEFLGVCGYYRRFNARHADSIASFRDLLSKGSTWKWTPKYAAAFEHVKQCFLETVTLHHHMANKRFRLQCDASDVGIAGILYQFDEEGEPRIISSTPRLRRSFSRWSTQ